MTTLEDPTLPGEVVHYDEGNKDEALEHLEAQVRHNKSGSLSCSDRNLSR